MVQTPFNPPRENWQPQDARLNGLAMRQAPPQRQEMNVHTALREYAGIPVKEYALFVILDNGKQNLYSSSPSVQNQVNFTPVWDELTRSVVRGERVTSFSGSGHEGMWTANNDLDSETSRDDRQYSNSENRNRRQQQRQSRSEESDEFGSSRRKRPRQSGYRRGSSNDTQMSVITSTKTQKLKIGDDIEVEKFYTGRFKDMQQNACKILGKAFVKIVEPKKQTHHPYTGGDANRPPWWPQAMPGETGYVRHKEPDHLYKAERILLLSHILRLIVLPNNEQMECLRNLSLNVKKLEDHSLEAMNNWFNDKDHKDNIDKKKYFKEIFKIARHQERYKAQQIDGTALFNVMFGDRLVDDSSEDEQDDSPIDDQRENQIPPHMAARLTPSDELVSPMMQNLKPEIESPSMYQTINRRAPPMRYASQAQLDEHQAAFSNPSYLNRGMNLEYQPHVHNDHQRAYASPVYQNTQSMYSNWNNQQGLVGSGASSSGFYTTSPQSSVLPSAGQYQLPALPTSSMLPPLANNSFDISNSRHQYDVGSAVGHQVVRTGSLGHPHVNHHGFPDYMTNNGFSQPDENQQHLHHPDHH